ncbi:hypothetical protein VQ042_18035 [Aurantimonas sp. A2-1-M11]|uniref:hypothetical protein n=1 Tax=Aurantimonas sp. A2-1-M11 TaxID=3113712 RepID=UPI002F92E1A1
MVDDPGFLAFAQIHLKAGADQSFSIGDGFATYAAFARGRGAAPLSRTSFGAMVAALAKRVGGGRANDVVLGLALRSAGAVPASVGLQDVPAPQPITPKLMVPTGCRPVAPTMSDASCAEPEDAVGRFLAARLVERHGSVLSLEALRAEVGTHGLRFTDVIERAKARGHTVRRNAWGPDFLTDAHLVDAPEAAE